MAQGKFSNSRRNNNPSRPASRGRKKKVVLVCLCSVAVFALLAAIGCLWFFYSGGPDDGLILNNITVAGINLGGMTPEQARQVLHQATDTTYTQQNMAVQMPDTTLLLHPAKTGAKLNVDAVVEAAYSLGRTGTRAEKKADQARVLSGSYPIALLPYLTLNTDYIRTTLEDYGAKFNSTYSPSSVTLEGEAPVLNAGDEGFDADAPCQKLVVAVGSPGRHVDIESAYNAVLDAYSFNRFEVTVEMDQAEKLPDAIDLASLYQEYHSDPVDAAMDRETYEVAPETYGYGFDLEQAQLQLEQAQYGDTLEIPFAYTKPQVLGEELKALLFRDVLASYETEHTRNEKRNTNLRLACEAINGLVLDPGEIFDYNTALGKRTAEKGYQEADAYSGGQTVKTLGGGICQVSSTLYYCTLIADLEIVERSPHSFVSSYMPMGMDATVSWGGPEFSFKNSTNYPIRIEAEVADGHVKVKLIGTDEKDYYVKMEYEVIGAQSPTTVYEEYTAAEAASKGYKDGQVITTAYKGYTVQTYKLKYDKETDELISREEDRLSKYKKRDKVVVKIVSSTAPTTPPSTTPPDAPPATNPPAPPATNPPAPPATNPPAPPATNPPAPPATNPPAPPEGT